jgi:CRP/FNR family cyclic AMP-dependent transcriptional regulator
MRANWIDRLPTAPRTALLAAMVRRSFPRGALIYSRTEAPQGLYLVRSGSVMFGLDGANGKRLLLRIVRENGLLGEAVAYDGRTAPASAEARSALVTDMIPAYRLRALRREHPEIEAALGRLAAANLRAVLGILEEQALLPLPERALRRLTALCRDDDSQATDDPLVRRLDLTQNEFAAMLGVSRQATNELLGQFEAAGIVTRRFKAIDCRLDLLPA